MCVLGGGFAGLYTALRLRSLRWPAGAADVDRVARRGEDLLAASAALRPPQLPLPLLGAASPSGPAGAGDEGPEVILVDKSDRFIFKPMLYELLLDDAQVWEICPRYDDLLAGSGVRFVREEVSAVEPAAGPGAAPGGTVTLGSGESLEYDWLVVALGAGPRATSVAGAREHAVPFATLDHALQISTRLAEMQARGPGGRVVVVGGGVSGVEVASTIAQRLGPGRVTILHGNGSVMEGAPARQREAACKVLERRGVAVRTGFRVGSVAAAADGGAAKLVAGRGPGAEADETLEADLVVWTAGQSPVSGPLVDAFPKAGTGAVRIERSLQVLGQPRVFAVGDVVLGEGEGAGGEAAKPLPATAQVAFQQSDFAAWNIWASINGKPTRPFRYQHLGDMMLLGSTDAAMTPLGIEGLTLDGPVAAAIRKATYLYRMPTAGHAAKVGASWALQPLLRYMSSRF